MEDEVGIFGGFNLVRGMTSAVNLKDLMKEVFKSNIAGKTKYANLEFNWQRKVAKEVLNVRKKKASPSKKKKDSIGMDI